MFCLQNGTCFGKSQLFIGAILANKNKNKIKRCFLTGFQHYKVKGVKNTGEQIVDVTFHVRLPYKFSSTVTNSVEKGGSQRGQNIPCILCLVYDLSFFFAAAGQCRRIITSFRFAHGYHGIHFQVLARILPHPNHRIGNLFLGLRASAIINRRWTRTKQRGKKRK